MLLDVSDLVAWMQRRCARRSTARWAWGLVLLAVVSTALYIHRYGVNALYMEEWLVVDAWRRHLMGDYACSEIWRQHNEHRLVVPKLLFWAEYAWLGDHSPRRCMFACLGMLCGLLGLFALEFRKLLPQSSAGLRAILFAPIAWVMLSWRQYENLLYGFQPTFVCAAAFAILALWMLARFAERDSVTGQACCIVSAACLAACASLSSAMGLIVWGVGALPVAMAAKRRPTWTVLWIGLSLGFWALYFHDYASPAIHPGWTLPWARPLTFLRFLLATVGAGGAPTTGLASVGGAVLCGYVAWRLVRLVGCGEREGLFWLSIALFGLGTASSLAIGRSAFGIEASTTPRYITFTLFVSVGCIALLYADALRLWTRRRRSAAALALGVAASIIAANVFSGLFWGPCNGRQIRDLNREVRRVVLGWRTATDAELSTVFPSPGFVRQNAAFCESRGLTPFAKPRQAPASPPEPQLPARPSRP